MLPDDIPKSELAKVKLYFRFVVSYSDFKHAHRCTLYSIAEHEKLEEKWGDDLILRALYGSMTIAYARPFNSYGNSQIGKLKPLTVDNLWGLSEKEKEIHEYFIFCRNKLIAHSDAEVIDPLPYVSTGGTKDLVFPITNDALAPFTKEYTAEVLEYTKKVYHFAVEEQTRLQTEVEKWLPRDVTEQTIDYEKGT